MKERALAVLQKGFAPHSQARSRSLKNEKRIFPDLNSREDILMSSNTVLVGIIMGSDSDLPVLKEAAMVLEEFGINYEITIVSAHRTPGRMFDYAENAEKRGLEVIIAGAGGAAHLPGMVAAISTLPVIGVPVKTSALNGLDSLFSIVQMPAGIPVATVAINNAKNAGLLAAQILSIKYPDIREKVKKYRQNMKSEVEKKAEKLAETIAQKHRENDLN
ncbi:MAG: 5-(carboxyamino)imidazole ribonucleotide mutase [Tepidanaerobacteraceae bacterium]|nr:5-(carboxyamino)imidazole ribonucleotide mutase [Tepidanaerobacteraceae bacterium]